MSGFRAIGGVAALLVVLGVAQLAALGVRDEPYPLSAAALAALLLAGGAVLAGFVAYNFRRGARSELPEPFTAIALALLASEAVLLYTSTGDFFPLRMTLWWRTAPADAPLALMVAGTCLIALGAVATAALLGALWLWLYASGRARASKAIGAALSFGGAVPYVAFALVVRAMVCKPVAFLAAGRALAVRPGDQLAYRSLFGMSPGFLAASIALGLCVGRGLWSWLEQVRAVEERSDSFLTGLVRGQKPWQLVLRQGLWLRRRRDLSGLLLGGMAAAALIDILSNTLIDSFRPPGFPPYPSLGAALFLRGLSDDAIPAPLQPAWRAAHVAVVLCALLLLLAQTFPRRRGRVVLANGALSIDRHLLASGVASAHGLPAVQWVLGTSGAGKSTLLDAWAAQLQSGVLAPQDPDDVIVPGLSATDLLKLSARPAVLWDLLGRLDDERIRRRVLDPFTPATKFSRGERQRLVVSMALARAHAEPASTLLLDEPTSAQDAARTHAMLEAVRALAPRHLVVCSHDPEALETRAAGDHVLWLDQGAAHDTPTPGLEKYVGAAAALLDARCEPVSTGAGESGIQIPFSELKFSFRSYAVAASVRAGELAVLAGPSGCGKTTLLRAIAARPPQGAQAGYVAQDPARAFPAEMPVSEVLGARPERTLLRRWFGAELSSDVLRRPISALSEGERQRILLAGEILRLEKSPAALHLLLLDEPFGAADPAGHLRLMEMLLAWLRERDGRAAVLVSHSPLVDLGLARASGVPTAQWSIDA